MNIKLISLIIVFLGMLSTVNAHGVDVTEQSVIVIADNSSGLMAKKLANEMGLNVSVYNFKSDADVSHQLEHALSDPNKRILAVAYQDTVNQFISENPDISDRIFVSSANETDIKNGLMLLTDSNDTGFAIPFVAGLVVGLVAGLGLGAFWMKKKIS